MKRKILCFLLTLALVFTLGLPGSGAYVHAASSEWSQAGPDPNLNRVTCLSEYNDQIYKGTVGTGVLDWNGTAWTQAGTGWPSEESVACLAGTSDALYGATYSGGVWALEDGVWTEVGVSSWSTYSDIAMSLTCIGETVYAGTMQSGVLAWNGTAWTQVGTDTWPMDPLGPDPGKDVAGSLVNANGTLYALTIFNGVWKLDSGGEWTQAGTDSWPAVMATCLTADAGGTVYAGTENSDVWKLDSDDSWDKLADSPSEEVVTNLMTDVNGTLYAGTNGGLWFWNSTDSDWTPVNDFPFPDHTGYELAFAGEKLYCGGGDHVYCLYDDNWQEAGSYDGLPYDGDNVYCLPLAGRQRDIIRRDHRRRF